MLLKILSRVALVLGLLLLSWQSALANHNDCNDNVNAFPGIIAYNTSVSYCELCGLGSVHIVITNPSTGDMTDFILTHDFGASQLQYVPGTTTVSVNGGGFVPAGDPTIAGNLLTWDATDIPALALIPGVPNHSYNTVEVQFQIRSTAPNEENLVNVSRNVQASVNFTFCPGTPWQLFNVVHNTGPVQLPIREPLPVVTKRGRNVDAGQGSGSYSATVYGNINDDVIWRIQVQNNGLAALQDLKFDDLMTNGNFQINYACPSEATAAAVSSNNGVLPAGSPCVAASNSINDFLVDDPFGNPANDEPAFFVDVPAGGIAAVYLVGKILNSCNANTTNTVRNVEWGCEVRAPDGGITHTSTGAIPAPSSTTLSSRVNNGSLNIVTQITGLNGTEPAGSRGLVTISITNNTGGSIKNIQLQDILPPEYVVDSTFTPTVTMTRMHGSYAGMINTVNWSNPAPNTFPLVSSNPAEPLANTAPIFTLTSSTTHPVYADQVNMLRHGDRAVIRFRVVMVPQPGFAPYDLAADLDVRTENTADTTDPTNVKTVTNQLNVQYEEFCLTGVQTLPTITTNHTANPEDLDIDISGPELIFILTNNPLQPLPLQVTLTNNGGHTADNYFAFITFGATMDVVTAPAGCSVTTNPPAREVWDIPVDIPANATVYQCTNAGLGTIAPGASVALDFEVIKSSDPADLAADDLTFRADVVGEIRLSNNTPLWFPTPDTAVINNAANNYSLDGLRARVIGFNLLKNQVGTCNENNPPPASPDVLVQIGEECSFNIHSGGWFGFQTPGFTYIAVQRITVTDELPDGQGYVSSTDPYLTSEASIKGISLVPQTNPPLDPLDEGWIDWRFNQVVPGERIFVKDQWFDVNVTTRILNDALNARAPPNLHAALSRNVLNSTFQAVFDNAGVEEVYDLGPSTIGYPQMASRRIDLTVTEPNIMVSKEVCNETLYGSGTACSNFVTLANDGDTQDSYIYRITLSNEASASGVPRAPAYNITTTDLLDPSDLVYVVPFAADGLDNDGDGLIDGADLDGEGLISDNIVENGVPPVITYAHNHSSALLRINPGATLTLYYRVDPDDSVAPLQQLNNSVSATYDSLDGDYGNQTVVQSATGSSGGARFYTSATATAAVRILPLLTQPKVINALSHTTAGPQPQPVSVGEEIEYELRAAIPIANLRNFTIRDELPPGLSCAEAPLVDLNAPPYSAAGFVPGGQFTPTCSGNVVEWNFGNQELTTAPVNTARFDFYVRFIARVDNSAITNNGVVLSNGTPATNAFLHYRDETNADITLNFGQHDVVVREPSIALTKTYSVASADAADEVTVTVTATNNGTAAAYNLRILDDLAAVANLAYVAGSSGGVNPPDSVDLSLGAKRPIFEWQGANVLYPIDPGETVSFTFKVKVELPAQPLEVLDNTISARWTSLPGQGTALNSSSLIGVDGAADGMRIGSLPNAGNAINDYEATVSNNNLSVPLLSMVKSDVNPAVAPTIGARKNFKIEIALPEGTTQGVVVTDNLNVSGVSYALENNASYDISYTFQNIASINGVAPAESAFNAFPADDSTGTVSWNIGTVVTAQEDDLTVNAVNPVIRINYYARINNDLNTNAGDNLQNSAQITYNHGETGTPVTLVSTPGPVTVVEPVLTASKTWRNVTVGKLPADLPDGGDVIEYRVTVSNSGNATAYDVNLVDALPAYLQLEGSFTPTAVIGGVPVSGFVAVPGGAPPGPLLWGRGHGDDTLDIPVGQDLILTYRVTLDAAVEPNLNLTNSVLVDWTSLQGALAGERHGNGCPTITAPNDYCNGPASAGLNVIDANSIVKAVINDSYAPANDATLRVGDIVTYRLAIYLQEGTTRNINLQDSLPAGLALVDVLSINGDDGSDGFFTAAALGAGSNFNYAAIANNAGSVPQPGANGVLTWNLGTVINNPLGDASTDTLVIEYRARVAPDAGIPQVTSTTLTNTVVLNYLDANNNPPAPASRLSDTATTAVLQPLLGSLTKTDRLGRASGLVIDPATDVMHFRLGVCNAAGGAPAYDVIIEDVLPSQMDDGSLSGPVNGAGVPDVYIDGVLATPGVDYIYTPPAGRGGTLHFSFIAPVNAGACVAIDYDMGFYTDFGVGQSWVNSVKVMEYTSLPAANDQVYPALGPVLFNMHNLSPVFPPAKTLQAPGSNEATIGEEVLYRVVVPSSPMSGALHDVTIADNLDPSLIFVSATDVSGNGFVITDNSILPNQVNLVITLIPAGQQAVVELRTRVNNVAAANAGTSFNNSASYTFATVPAGPQLIGGGDTTVTPLRLVEPLVSIGKAVANLTNPGNPPDAGDRLRYTLTLSAAGGVAGDIYSDAFDVTLNDMLSLGLAYSGNVTVNGAGNTIAAPSISGDGVTVAQTLLWGPASGNADIDIPEAGTVTVSYDVVVLDSVVANQNLTNSVVARWTSVDGNNLNERDGSAAPAYNDYYTAAASTSLTTPDNNTIVKTRLTDTWGAADANVRVGDLVEYQLRLNLQEGTTPNVVLMDTLSQGLAYVGIVSINGDSSAPYSAVAPYSHSDILASAGVVAGDPLSGPTTVSWNLGTIINSGDNLANNDFVIVYRARVLDQALPQVNSTALQNTVNFAYHTATGAAPIESSNVTVTLLQPNLTVSKSAVAAGGDTVLDAGEVVTYTVDITNTGSAPAYDTVLQDVIPVGMRNGAATITMVSTQLLVAGTVLPNLAPAYNPATGLARWDFDSGVANQYTIPAGDTLRVVYRVQADSGLAPGLMLTNQAQVPVYYSFDDEAVPNLGAVSGVREIYGPSNIATVTLTTPAPHPLLKQNPAGLTASIGAPFTYRITVPDAPQATALHDVRIVDDLVAAAADLVFVSVNKVAGTQPWTPVNTGSSTSLVIEDVGTGIDIPAGEQIVIDVTVMLRNTPVNVSGLAFNNTALYTYNQVNNDNGTQALGGSSTTPDMTIVEPLDMVISKTGPATMQFNAPQTFTITVQNVGSGPAWDLTITDVLPNNPSNPNQGGMCDSAPSNITAQVFLADGVTPVSAPLVAGSDFVASYSAAPACTLTLTMQTAAASIAPTNILILSYSATLDGDSVNGALLTNTASATQWFSADTAGAGATGEIRTYPSINPLPSTTHTVTVAAPVLDIEKRVVNVSTGQDPGFNAEPGETLRYSVVITNSGPLPVSNFSLTDELDGLNATAMFQAGSLSIVSVPVGANTSNTAAHGGSKGSGLLDVRNLNLDAAGGPNDSLTLEFEATLVPVIASGTVVLNQAWVNVSAFSALASDDRRPALPDVADPTETIIGSLPGFQIFKTSQDLSGAANFLLPGDTLRYSITVKNTGSENAINTMLRDQIPANTTYVANSTTLNGVAVADPSPGVAPVQMGMLIHAPENTTPGYMRADASAAANNVATVRFAVVVNADVVNGTVISNQAYVSPQGAGSGPVTEYPSDDPDTALYADPTQDVVGNLPILDAQKTVSLWLDGGTPNQVDPGDTLRYTLTVANSGAVPASGVMLTDAVPANTTYVADSVTLNGLAVAQPDGGVSPLIAGIALSSAELTPPVPTGGNGVINPGQSAIITFDVTVDGAVAPGTVLSNQGSVSSNELPTELTDADGNDENGDQPTEIVVGPAQLLRITKEVMVVGGGVAQAGGQLEYLITVQNIGTVSATDVRITDNLNLPLAGQKSYVSTSARLNGATTGISYAAPLLTADYAAAYGDLGAGASTTLRFRVDLNTALAYGTPVSNTAQVSWNAGTQTASASATVDIGGAPGVANLNGSLWHDVDFDNVKDNTEGPLANWTAEIYLKGQLLDAVVSDASGNYRIVGLTPSAVVGGEYELRFLAPGASANTAALGQTDSLFTDAPQHISNISVAAGNNLLNLNLPIDPNGVIYDAVLRTPVIGATVTLLNAGSNMPVAVSCFNDPAQQNQITLVAGFYKFDLNFSQPDCTPGADYLLQVTPPASGYNAGPSLIIPPTTSAATAAFDVPACPASANDAVAATPGHCEVQASELAPPASVAAGTAETIYYLKLRLDDSTIPGSSQLFNHHIPLDPDLVGAIAIAKTSALLNVVRGQLVPYTITLSNTLPVALTDLNIVDDFPAGFKYVVGSAHIDGVASEPTINGQQLRWSNLSLAAGATRKISLLLIVGSGVSEADYVNRVQAFNEITGGVASGMAMATVRVVPDPTFDCSDIIGKVFDDANLNGYQDEGEKGIADVRLVTARGLLISTDAYGRFHVACAAVPNQDRGSNFIIKLDEQSLPSGYRLTTENPRVQRVTRGKLLKFNFGAGIHHVVRLDLADAVFEPGAVNLRPQWQPRLDVLLTQLQKSTSILRLSYLADTEDPDLVDKRITVLKEIISERWQKLNCCYRLMIETEVFWRRGAPASGEVFE